MHQMIGEPTIAPPHLIDRKGDSMRRKSPTPGLTPAENPEIINTDA